MSLKTESPPKNARKKSKRPAAMPTDPIQRTLLLCATYSTKLESIKKRMLDSQKASSGRRFILPSFLGTREEQHLATFDRLAKLSRPLIHAAEDLARFASGIIENANLEQLDRIELMLRNAELEAELIELKQLTISA
jgi:hypothetical protein